jgi:hypothetical protein
MAKQCKHKPSSMQNVIRGSSLRHASAGYGKVRIQCTRTNNMADVQDEEWLLKKC